MRRRTAVGAVLAAALLAAAAVTAGVAGLVDAGPVEGTVELAAIARSWPERFELRGTKSEPTYVEHVTLVRDGDRFRVDGGALAGMTPSTEEVTVAADGTIRHTVCPPPMDCATPRPFTGFLASAAVVAAARRGSLTGEAPVLRFGDRRVVCVPGELLGVERPVLDPCLDLATGAVLAQRHRRSLAFDGPSLDPWSIRIAAP